MLEEVAEQGFAYAQESIGLSLHFGENGYPRDPQKAFEWFNKAAKLGYPSAMTLVGDSFYNGHGVPKNKKQAKWWYYKAASLGDFGAEAFIKREEKKFFPWGF